MTTAMPLEGRSLAILVVSVAMMSGSVATVAFRSFVRVYVVRAFGWDDALMVTAVALFTMLTVCCVIGSINGIGHKYEDFTSLVTYKKALVWWWLGQMLYIWASAVAKVSIAVALLRLAVKKVHRVILWAVIGIVIVIGLMFWLVLLLDCHPISYFWNRVDPTISGSCLPLHTLLEIAYLYSTITILCDLTLGILPLALVWKLQMNQRTKIAVGGILSLGAIASVAVIIRIPFLHFYADENFLYSTYQIAIWSVVETGLGIIAGSLITLRPLFRWLLDGSTAYGRYARSPPKGSRKYPNSGPKTERLNTTSDPGYWRPDIDPDKAVVNTVSSPRSATFEESKGSQKALYIELSPAISRNRVTIQKTFVQVVTERKT